MYIQDAFCGGSCPGEGGHVGNPALDRRLSEIAVVVNAVFADRGVHDQVDSAVCDQVKDIGTAFVELLDGFCLDACLREYVVCPAGGDNLKARLLKEP